MIKLLLGNNQITIGKFSHRRTIIVVLFGEFVKFYDSNCLSVCLAWSHRGQTERQLKSRRKFQNFRPKTQPPTLSPLFFFAKKGQKKTTKTIQPLTGFYSHPVHFVTARSAPHTPHITWSQSLNRVVPVVESKKDKQFVRLAEIWQYFFSIFGRVVACLIQRRGRCGGC